MRSALRRWLLKIESDRPVPVETLDGTLDAGEEFKFSVLKVANGTIMKVTKHKPNPRGSDWIHELHIVKDGETVVDLFSRLYTIHILEQK
jgi:hypothetical protein